MDNNKNDIYIYSLSNIQKIITRLSNIGYALFTITLTLLSIIASIIFSLNLDNIWKLWISIISLVLISIFFGVNIINLRNEKVFIQIYNNKTKLNIEESTINEILSLGNFPEMKKEVKIFTCVKSFLTWMWFAVSLLPISMLIYSILLFF
ncbi:MAG: hypothetical protein KFW07_00030 [Mycoplasmataceae bacterium]|nr:hypothetical protein [Mycoplasmataceae bacterium]